MNQTEYLVSFGAPPLPKGWYYEVRNRPDYDKERDKWYTLIDVKIWDSSTKLLSSAQYRMASKYFTELGPKHTLDAVKRAYRSIGVPDELDPRHLMSLRTFPTKEPND